MKNFLDAALGKVPCDLVFRDITFLDVFSGSWKQGDVSIYQGKIVGLDSGLKAIREVNGKGKFLVPGFIDAHVHIESSLVVPKSFEKTVLPLGTTTAICDPHELTNVLGPKALQYFLDESENLNLDLRVMLSSCVPATHLETNGGGAVLAKDLVPFKDHPKALGLAEMMNVPGVLYGDEVVHEKLRAFQDRPIDGHCPLLTGKELSAYAMMGISSCHESSELEEAREKLTKGVSVWIREGSVAKDLDALSPLLTIEANLSLGFCTDDRNPLDIAEEGHLNFLIKMAIAKGVDPVVAYRSASYSVANHYGLNRGPDRLGAIAPGFRADLVLLSDIHSCAIEGVLKSGKWTNELDLKAPENFKAPNTIFSESVTALDLEGVKGQVHVMEVIPGKIITGRAVLAHDHAGVAKISVIERHGQKRKPANAYVLGFGESFDGAIASSVGHDSHNLIVVGNTTKDMAVAVNSLRAQGGGFCVVKGGEVIASLALPFGGLMSVSSPDQVRKSLQELRRASREINCALHEPFLQLAFLSLPVIPSLKLTDLGLVDVDQFKLIDVRAA